MTRLAVLLLAPLAGLALAAPVPKPRAVPFYKKPGWGKPIDLDKDCRFVERPESLRIEVPGKAHVLERSLGRDNAPKLLCKLTGAFRMQARLTADWSPSVVSADGGREVRVGAGFVLFATGKPNSVFSVLYGAKRELGTLWGTLALASEVETRPGDWDGHGSEQGWSGPVARVAYLRLERRGSDCIAWHSPDGKKWRKYTHPANRKPPLPEQVEAGLLVCSTSTGRLTVTFDQFRLTELGPNDK